MRVIQFLPVLAGLSSAFLIPAKVSDDVAEAFQAVSNALTEKLNGNPTRQTVKLECKDCPYLLGESDNVKAYAKIDNSLVFDVEASQTEQHGLRINGLEIFKPSPYQHLSAIQIPDNDDTKIATAMPRAMVKLNYEIFVSTVTPNTRNVRLHVLSVDGIKTHKKMDIIDLTVVADAEGILKIAKIEARHPTKSEASAAMCKMNMVCRWKAYFKDRLLGMKGQGAARVGGEKGKRPGCHGKPKPNRPGHKEELHHGHKEDHHHGHKEDHHHHGQPHGHHPHRHAKLLKFMMLVMRMILSLAMGVAAGFVISFIGVAVGHVVVMTYRLITGKTQKPFSLRCKKCGGCKKEAVDEETEGLLNEKTSVEAENEELPAYTDSEGVLRGDEKTDL